MYWAFSILNYLFFKFKLYFENYFITVELQRYLCSNNLRKSIYKTCIEKNYCSTYCYYDKHNLDCNIYQFSINFKFLSRFNFIFYISIQRWMDKGLSCSMGLDGFWKPKNNALTFKMNILYSSIIGFNSISTYFDTSKSSKKMYYYRDYCVQ